MSVCKKHRLQRRTSCACRITTRPHSDGYGGPDVTSVAVELLEGSGSSIYDSGSSTYDSGSSSSWHDSGSSSGSYDSGSSSGSSDSW